VTSSQAPPSSEALGGDGAGGDGAGGDGAGGDGAGGDGVGGVPLTPRQRRPGGALGTSPAARRAVSGPRARRTRRRLAACGLVLAAAIGFLLYKGLTSAFVYFKTASQAVAGRAELGNSTFQIEGTVVPCTIRKTGVTSLDFSITSGSTRVAVRDSGTPPSLFQPDVAVVLGGHFVGSSNVFASDQIFIKHSNQYVAAHPGRLGRQGLSTRCPATT
jgi:cytochrome c-type biogenesis protein CcmE